MFDAKEKDDAHHDQTDTKKVECREEVRQELRSAHLKSTTLALSEAESGRMGGSGFFDGWRREQALSGSRLVFSSCAERLAGTPVEHACLTCSSCAERFFWVRFSDHSCLISVERE